MKSMIKDLPFLKYLNRVVERYQEKENLYTTTEITRQRKMSASRLSQIFKQFHPYKAHLITELATYDPDRRLQFCEIFMRQRDKDPEFSNHIMFSNGITLLLINLIDEVNRHKSRYWYKLDYTQIPQKHHVK